ncbi:MAG: diguanylate cyclase [Pirellulales bacterium]
MKTISATTRIAFGLICLAVSVGMLAYMLGMFPDRQAAVVQGRVALCENLAINCSLLASRNDRRTMQQSLEGLVHRNEDLQSAAIRRPDGELLISVGPHAEVWNLPSDEPSTPTHMRVPVMSGDSEWGQVELRFRDPPSATGWLAGHPLVAWGLFSGAATYLLFFAYLRKILQHLDPTRVIPRRVRGTLDSMAEGLLVLDPQQRILLANRAFADSLGVAAEELTGRKVSELPFDTEEKRLKIEGYPWDRALNEGTPQLDEILTLRGKYNRTCIMKVSATPIFGDDGKQRGALASFSDVTSFEQSRVELRQMLDALSHSRDEIQQQNQELERLAARDPLTGCLNRRSFFVDFESQWSTSARHGYPLTCIMVDLDHFKSINDTHGHQAGDMVLQKAAEQLRKGRRPSDLVCRYGGEEFCVLLPHTGLDDALTVANQIRKTIESTDFNGIAVTASLGLSSRGLGANNPQELIDQADKCLYVAKRRGRNCAVRFDQAADEIAAFEQSGEAAAKQAKATSAVGEENRDPTIPFQAVTALVSALAYRDQATADHARRVADLCVAAARRLMPASQSYHLEIAALLHDIGKIGVPDAILLKPSKLTDEEWQVMDSHERIGEQIVHSAFSSPTLVEIIRSYRAWFGGNPKRPELPTGDDIPLSARILAIADAYDSMTSPAAYRQPLSREQAFAEIRRCAARQFDPDLTEWFIDSVISREGQHSPVKAETANAAALSLGTQIERLAEALDSRDMGSIATLAGRLRQAADMLQASDIAAVAGELHEAARQESDVKELVQLTVELLDLCRSAQRAYLNGAASSAKGSRTEAPVFLDSGNVVDPIQLLGNGKDLAHV